MVRPILAAMLPCFHRTSMKTGQPILNVNPVNTHPVRNGFRIALGQSPDSRARIWPVPRMTNGALIMAAPHAITISAVLFLLAYCSSWSMLANSVVRRLLRTLGTLLFYPLRRNYQCQLWRRPITQDPSSRPTRRICAANKDKPYLFKTQSQ